MDIDPDECLHPGQEAIDWDQDTFKAIDGRAAGAKYSVLSEGARQLLSEERQCALFCGGKKCKYCNSDGWTDEQKAIKGLFSHWVTENILAMARPSTQAIEKHDIVQQFKQCGIKSVINLQKPGEHASCGGKLDDSGFSYNPQLFMDNDIFFYNFGWPDYGVASLNTILDMVKVMQFAVSQGKVAIHCHAGLGRTGVLIACYLVFTNRMEPNEAIHYIRSKRPNAVQTRVQIQCICEFHRYLKPLRIVFASRSSSFVSDIDLSSSDVSPDSYDFTFIQYLNRQKHMLHGFEARRLKYLPKIIYIICERLLELSGSQHVISRTSSPSSSSSQSRNLGNSDPETQSISSGSSRNNLMVPMAVHKSLSTSDLTRDEHTPHLSHSRSQQQLHQLGQDVSHSKVKQIAAQIDEGPLEETRDSQASGPLCSGVGETKDGQAPGLSCSAVAEALATDEYTSEVMEKVTLYKTKLNDSVEAWQEISKEADIYVLSALLWDWLNHLKEPALRPQDLAILSDQVEDPESGVQRLEKGIRYTLEYFMKVLVHLQPLADDLEDRVFEILLSHLTHKIIRHDITLRPTPMIPSHWGEIKSSSANKLFHFFYRYLDIVQESINKPQKMTNGWPQK